MVESDSRVRLTGRLICETAKQAEVVRRHLDEHKQLTQAEPGCISFAVAETANPLVWTVNELFVDADAFRAHQARVAQSAWGEATQGIERDYVIKMPE